MPTTATLSFCPQQISIPRGPTVIVRRLTTADREVLRRLFDDLSPASRYLRFLQAVPAVPESTLDALLEVDQRRHLGLVGVADGVPVAEACLVIESGDPRRAEVAYTVTDSLHRRGVGRAMLGLLLDAAAANGVATVHAVVSPENRASIGLLRSFGAAIGREDGLTVAELPVRAALADAA
jgi:acetyltransferase